MLRFFPPEGSTLSPLRHFQILKTDTEAASFAAERGTFEQSIRIRSVVARVASDQIAALELDRTAVFPRK